MRSYICCIDLSRHREGLLRGALDQLGLLYEVCRIVSAQPPVVLSVRSLRSKLQWKGFFTPAVATKLSSRLHDLMDSFLSRRTITVIAMKDIIVQFAITTYPPWSSSLITQCGGDRTAKGFGSDDGGPLMLKTNKFTYKHTVQSFPTDLEKKRNIKQ
jgi:hypothetical protein